MIYPLLILMFLTPWALGSPAEESSSLQALDKTHDALGERINSLANRIDSFFATERADDELGRSTVRIRHSYSIRERELPDQDTKYRINLRIPHLEEKFRFDYYREQKDKKNDKKAGDINETNKKNKVKTGWTFNADAGVSLAIPPRIITRARLRRNVEWGPMVHRFAEELTYITDESGLVEETIFHSDKRIKENMLFRFVNSKRWQILKKNFTTRHGPTWLHQLTDNDGFSYNAITSSVIDNGVWYVSAYTLSINYRRNLYKNWLYLDIIPGIEFPKVWSFRRTPFTIFQLELLFGG